MAERDGESLFDFSGGMNSDNAPLTLADNEAELIVNYKLNRYGGLRKRFGMLDTGAGQEVGNYPILAIGGGICKGGTTLIHTNGTLYEWSGSSWISRIASVGSAVPADFTYWPGNVSGTPDPDAYTFFNGAGGTYTQSSDNGTSWTTRNLPDSSLDFRPYFIQAWEGRLYAARTSTNENIMYVSGSTIPTYAAGSTAGNGDNAGEVEEITWDLDNDWIDFDPQRDLSNPAVGITGLHVSSGRFYVFNESIMKRYDGSFTVVADVGAWWNTLITTNKKYGITFFAGPQGIYAYSPYEGRPRCISNKISRIYHELIGDPTAWVDTSNSKWGAAVCDSEHLYIRPTGDITYDGKTLTNPVLCYNIQLDAWTIFTFDKAITCFYVPDFVDLGDDSSISHQEYGQEIIAGTADGYVQAFQDTTKYEDDGGVPIQCEYRSKEFLLNAPNLAALDEITVASIENGRTQVFFDTDRSGDFTSAGELSGRFSHHPIRKAPKGHSARIRFTSNDNNPSTVEGMTLEFTRYDYNYGKEKGQK